MTTLARLFVAVCILISVSGCPVSGLNHKPGYPAPPQGLDLASIDWLSQEVPLDLGAYADQALRPGQALPETDIVLSVAGGGQRAAMLALGVLLELESMGLSAGQDTDRPNLLGEIDYISSVSGGGWGIGAYLANRKRHQNRQAAGNNDAYMLHKEYEEILPRLRALRHTQLDRCLARRVKQCVTAIDDTPVQDCKDEPSALEARATGRFLRLSDVFVPPGETPMLPYSYANAAVADDASSFVFTPAVLQHFRVARFEASQCEDIDSEVVATAHSELRSTPFAVGLTASSSIQPQRHVKAKLALCASGQALHGSSLCSGDKQFVTLNLVDNGMIDVLGYRTAFEILRTSPKTRKRRVAIVLDANASVLIPQSDRPRRTSFGVLVDSAGSILDGSYQAFYQLGPNWAKEVGVQLVALRAEDIPARVFGQRPRPADARATIPRSDERLQGLCSLQDEICDGIGACDMIRAYYIPKCVRTSYLTDEPEQRLVSDFGRFLVRLNADRIRTAVGIDPSASVNSDRSQSCGVPRARRTRLTAARTRCLERARAGRFDR